LDFGNLRERWNAEDSPVSPPPNTAIFAGAFFVAIDWKAPRRPSAMVSTTMLVDVVRKMHRRRRRWRCKVGGRYEQGWERCGPCESGSGLGDGRARQLHPDLHVTLSPWLYLTIQYFLVLYIRMPLFPFETWNAY
jgi:hypothetical protein